MRILQISHGIYPAAQAGTEIYTAELANELIRQGHDVTVAIPATLINSRAEAEGKLSPFVVLVKLTPGGTSGNRFKYTAFRRPFWHSELHRLIKATKTEVIHVQHGMGFGLSLIDVLEESGLPIVIGLPDYWLTCPGFLRECDGNVFQCARRCCWCLPFAKRGYPVRLIQAFVHRWKVKRFVARARPYLAAISPKLQHIFESDGFSSKLLHQHPYGIDVLAIRESSATDEAEPLRQPRIGFMGTVAQHKGCHILAEAFVRAQPLDATLHFHGAGDGIYDNMLKQKYANTNVTFHGEFDHSSVAQILSGLDIVVIPSICEEAYCFVAQEALAARKVMIASDTGGIADRIVTGVNGFLVPPNDVAALSDELSRIVPRLTELVKTMDFDKGLLDIREDARRWAAVYKRLSNSAAELALKSPKYPIEKPV
jgi:glycosyltransferase involved in cell wall biosynthesis